MFPGGQNPHSEESVDEGAGWMEDNGFLKEAACELSHRSGVTEPRKGSWKAGVLQKHGDRKQRRERRNTAPYRQELSKAWRGSPRPAGGLGWALVEEKQYECATSFLGICPLSVPQRSMLTVENTKRTVLSFCVLGNHGNFSLSTTDLTEYPHYLLFITFHAEILPADCI